LKVSHIIEILKTIDDKGAIPMVDLYIKLNFSGMEKKDFDDAILIMEEMDILYRNLQGYIKGGFAFKGAKRLLVDGEFI